MTVSKRTRFEVLRRDDNTCRYCGGQAPDVTLTVDHVTPVSLGGSDDPSNLVAACKDCNAGKSSSQPDAPLVAGVSDDALRWAAALREAADRRMQQQHEQVLLHDRFLDLWETTPAGSYREPELPDDWWQSVQSILSAGLPELLLHDAVRKSFAARHVSAWDKFRYMCGICWRQVTEIQEEAKASLVEVENAPSEEIDWRSLPWDAPEQVAYDKGFNNGQKYAHTCDFSGRLIEDFIDKRATGRVREVMWTAEAA